MGSRSGANLRKTLHYLKRNGLRSTWYAVREQLEEHRQAPYVFVPAEEEQLEKQRVRCADKSREHSVVFSIVVPTYRTAEGYLRDMINSVRGQTYPFWELVLADATEDDSVKQAAESYQDARIRYIRLSENGGISQNTNQGIAQAMGNYIGLLDHDDVLTKDALYEMAAAIEKGKEKGIGIKMLYSDEDKCNGEGTQFYEPNKKEKFNLDLLLSNNYICHFLVLESGLMKELEFRSQYDGAQDYDLVLRAVGRLLFSQGTQETLSEREAQIVHIPRVLYHWRCHEASTAQNPQSKQYAYEAGRRALQDFADRAGWNARAVSLKHLGFYELVYGETFFEDRADVGAVGGRILKKGKIAGGRWTDEGILLYEGLPAAYSGRLHRAVLSQDADAVDIRCIRVREECRQLFEEVIQAPYRETKMGRQTDQLIFDVSVLPGDADYRKLSIALGQALRKAGYRILYLPSMASVTSPD